MTQCDPLQTLSGRFDPQAPLLIIGAGRSGSTLLARALGAHARISMRGETDFLTFRLWEQWWGRRFWLDWERFVETRPTSSRDPCPPLTPDEEARHRDRIGRIIARAVAETLAPDPAAAVWGFKEIWNGSQNHDHQWDAYDAVFPRAVWIHLVRHPLDYVRSCVAWNRDELTAEQARHRLIDWLGIVERSRQRAIRGSRFVELRYEDLAASPRASLEGVLSAAALAWDERCLAPFAERVLASRDGAASHERAITVPRDRRLERLPELASSLDYDLSAIRWCDLAR